jgi:hypothetical protein
MGTRCKPEIAKMVTDALRASLNQETESEFLVVCCPCYNEEFEELFNTITSFMQTVEFFKRQIRLQSDGVGSSMTGVLAGSRIVFCPIFDGQKALSATMKYWLLLNFPGFIDDFLNDECTDEVRVGLYKWWYYSSTAISGFETSATELAGDSEQNLINFYITPIIKRNNHRKHNSHEWFFDSICEGLHERLTYVFLTDCGTTYSSTCLVNDNDISYKLKIIGLCIYKGSYHAN